MNQTSVERNIERVWTVEPQRESDKHTVGMVLEPGRWTQYDPFLMLAEDWFGQGTFDVHPHRGMETVTYVIEGTLQHYDNQFWGGELLPGDVQWMTAGRGVIHKEDPMAGERVHSLQLWVNLPSEHKLTEPRYQNLKAVDMPVRKEEGALIRVFSGNSGDVVSDTKNFAPVTMVEINVTADHSVLQDLPSDYRGFLYVLEGNGTFGANRVRATKGQVLWMEGLTDDVSDQHASHVEVSAIDDLRVLLYAGRPLHEPVAAYGPFVMNTQEQIREAFADYQSGKFGN